MTNKYNIHVFKTLEGNYMYDVNTDSIVKIPESVYNYLELIEKDLPPQCEEPEYIHLLKNQGYLKTKHVYKTEHPETILLRAHAANRLEGIILQVTQNCNLNCTYCAYSGSYYNRVHSNKRMSLDIAKSAVDFYVKRTKNIDRLTIGFYGGEPLLEFRLIQHIVEYINSKVEFKQVMYTMTTNATLLVPDIVEFLVEQDFQIVISLDGPKEIHDKNRKFCDGGGSFDIVMKNLEMLKSRYPKYYRDNVSFNSVLETDKFNCVEQFFCKDKIFSRNTILTTLVNDVNAKVDFSKNNQFTSESKYSAFLSYLMTANRLNLTDISPLNENLMNILTLIRRGKTGKQRFELPDSWHHGGPCIPGVFRLFIDVDGTFFPCEKVSESSEDMIIGNLENGFDYNKMEAILNIERMNADDCHSCWAYSECKLCVGGINMFDNKETLKERCDSIRADIEEEFRDYCALCYLGYDNDRGITRGIW